jgi:hypothetical protein
VKEVSDDSTAGTASAVSLLARGSMTLGTDLAVWLACSGFRHDFRDSTTLGDLFPVCIAWVIRSVSHGWNLQIGPLPIRASWNDIRP